MASLGTVGTAGVDFLGTAGMAGTAGVDFLATVVTGGADFQTVPMVHRDRVVLRLLG